MNAERIIERFSRPDAGRDGIEEVAAAFGLSPKAVWQWTKRSSGIPGKYHLPLLRLARERGIPLSEDELLSTTRLMKAS